MKDYKVVCVNIARVVSFFIKVTFIVEFALALWLYLKTDRIWWVKTSDICDMAALFILAVICGALIAWAVSRCFEFLFLERVYKHDIRTMYGAKSARLYGYKSCHASDIIERAFSSLRVSSAFGIYHDKVRVHFDDVLSMGNLGLKLYRTSGDDIERDRDRAEKSMSAYEGDRPESELRYLIFIQKRDKENRCLHGVTFSKSLLGEIREYLFGSHDCEWGELAWWAPRHSLLIFTSVWFLLVALCYSDIETCEPIAREYVCEQVEAFAQTPAWWQLVMYVPIRVFGWFASWMVRLFIGDGGEWNCVACYVAAFVFVIRRIGCWWSRREAALAYLFYKECFGDAFDEDVTPNYKESTERFLNFMTPLYHAASGFKELGPKSKVDIFRAFLDLHKGGWRMKIFPFSKERLAEEKRLSEERGEEYVVYPDVEDAILRAEEKDREIERIGEM